MSVAAANGFEHAHTGDVILSKQSEMAQRLLEDGRLQQAGLLAMRAAREIPGDWHCHYILGQCFRYENNYGKACVSLARAHELNPSSPNVLLALGIAHQLNADLPSAINALRKALDLDADFVLAYNSLGMTQKLMGEYEKALHNYDAGAKVLAANIARSLQNSASSPRLPHGESRNHIWLQYALGAAMGLALDANIDEFAWPTDKMAERDRRTGFLRGWYWNDEQHGTKKLRMYCPNYFNTLRVRLGADLRFSNLMGNRSTVLRMVGQQEEADRHAEEAEDFMQQ